MRWNENKESKQKQKTSHNRTGKADLHNTVKPEIHTIEGEAIGRAIAQIKTASLREFSK
jgi:hypothetical protein